MKHIKIACHVAPKTCREWAQMWIPEKMRSRFDGGVIGCPSNYIRGAECRCADTNRTKGNELCTECWNQPMPEVMA